MTEPVAYAPVSMAGLARWLIAAQDDATRHRPVQEFLEEWEHAEPGERADLLAERPPKAGDRRFDALLAGLAEHLAWHCNLRVPLWAIEPNAARMSPMARRWATEFVRVRARGACDRATQ